MRLPETDNIHYQYAFKKGYRMAIDGKSVNSMPSDIRRDLELRQYFQDGWEQAVEDVTLAQQEANKPDWKHRFIWFGIMVVGGLATAVHIVNMYKQERAEQQSIINGQLHSQNEAVKPNPAAPTNKPLSLLSESQRSDLQASKKELIELVPLEKISSTEIRVTNSAIFNNSNSTDSDNRFDSHVPKYIRNLTFEVNIGNANGQKISHRWRTDTQIIATIDFKISASQQETKSSQQLASAWQGKWYVEILNENKNVIYRKAFYYGNQE